MTPIRTIPALLLLVVCILLAAGCTENEVSTVPTTTAFHVSTQNATPTVMPSIYWIKIDPVGDKQAGDVFTINATTNLSAGQEILVQVYEPWMSQMKSSTFIPSGTTGTVKVIEGNNGINTISFVVNSSTFHPKNFYTVAEMADNNDPVGYAFFNITSGKNF